MRNDEVKAPEQVVDEIIGKCYEVTSEPLAEGTQQLGGKWLMPLWGCDTLDQLRDHFIQALTVRLHNPAELEQVAREAAKKVRDYIALPDNAEPDDSNGSPTDYIARLIHTVLLSSSLYREGEPQEQGEAGKDLAGVSAELQPTSGLEAFLEAKVESLTEANLKGKTS